MKKMIIAVAVLSCAVGYGVESSSWAGSTGLYTDYEEAKSGGGDHSVFLKGSFKKEKSDISYNYKLMKTYDTKNDNEERTRVQVGASYNYDTGMPYTFGVSLGYRDELLIESTEGTSTSGKNIHGFLPSIDAAYSLGKMAGVYTSASFLLERRASHGSGDSKEYSDYEHEFVLGAFYKLGKSQKLSVEYSHAVEDHASSYLDTIQQAQVSYAYTLENGVVLNPYYRHGLEYKAEEYDSATMKNVHISDYSRQHYGFKFKVPVTSSITLSGNYYYRDIEEKTIDGGKKTNDYKHYGAFGFNYSY